MPWCNSRGKRAQRRERRKNRARWKDRLRLPKSKPWAVVRVLAKVRRKQRLTDL